jgi:hypothetical protein
MLSGELLVLYFNELDNIEINFAVEGMDETEGFNIDQPSCTTV